MWALDRNDDWFFDRRIFSRNFVRSTRENEKYGKQNRQQKQIVQEGNGPSQSAEPITTDGYSTDLWRFHGPSRKRRKVTRVSIRQKLIVFSRSRMTINEFKMTYPQINPMGMSYESDLEAESLSFILFLVVNFDFLRLFSDIFMMFDVDRNGKGNWTH